MQRPEDRSRTGPEALVERLGDLTEGPKLLPTVVAFGAEAVGPLELMVRGPSDVLFQPRCLAADALAIIGSRDARQALVRALRDSGSRRLEPVLDLSERAVINCIARHLGRMGDVACADAILEVFAARRAPGCARALGWLGDTRAVPLMIQCLRDDMARDEVMEALASLGPKAEPALCRALISRPDGEQAEAPTSVSARAAIAAILGRVGTRACTLALTWALWDEEQEVRFAAALALCERFGPAAIPTAAETLIDALGARDWSRAQQAFEALQADVSCVIDRLTPHVRRWPVDDSGKRRKLLVVDLLGRVPTEDACRALASLSDDPDSGVRARAAQAISAALETSPQVAEALKAFQRDPSPTVRLILARALPRINPLDRSLAATMLTDSDAHVRKTASVMIHRRGREAEPLLRELAQAPHRYVDGLWASVRVRTAAERLLAELHIP